MRIEFELKMGMVLYHKVTMKEFDIDNTIRKVYNEDSQEYKKLCEEYKEIIGFERDSDKDSFDKELMKELMSLQKDIYLETVKQISDVVKKCYSGNFTGYIDFAGYIINPNDFCAMSVKEFSYKFKKI